MAQVKTKYHGVGSEQFRADCAAAGIEPTDRQWRKYQRGEGAAYAASPQHARELAAAEALRRWNDAVEAARVAHSREHLLAVLR